MKKKRRGPPTAACQLSLLLSAECGPRISKATAGDNSQHGQKHRQPGRRHKKTPQTGGTKRQNSGTTSAKRGQLSQPSCIDRRDPASQPTNQNPDNLPTSPVAVPGGCRRLRERAKSQLKHKQAPKQQLVPPSAKTHRATQPTTATIIVYIENLYI